MKKIQFAKPLDSDLDRWEIFRLKVKNGVIRVKKHEYYNFNLAKDEDD